MFAGTVSVQSSSKPNALIRGCIIAWRKAESLCRLTPTLAGNTHAAKLALTSRRAASSVHDLFRRDQLVHQRNKMHMVVADQAVNRCCRLAWIRAWRQILKAVVQLQERFHAKLLL